MNFAKPYEDLHYLKDFYAQGIMRRFAGLLNHRKAGFRANGMGVWQVPKKKVEKVGEKFASFRAVSHCYERPTFPNWPYNLFSMIHGKTREEVEELAREMAEEVGLEKYFLLFSTREFKKVRLKYFTPEYQEWENQWL